jgi:hypothetical protein
MINSKIPHSVMNRQGKKEPNLKQIIKTDYA